MLARLHFGSSFSNIWHSNSIGHSGVSIHEALFATNPALGNQTIIAPLSYDAEYRVGA
jgi:hypothetical protein